MSKARRRKRNQKDYRPPDTTSDLLKKPAAKRDQPQSSSSSSSSTSIMPFFSWTDNACAIDSTAFALHEVMCISGAKALIESHLARAGPSFSAMWRAFSMLDSANMLTATDELRSIVWASGRHPKGAFGSCSDTVLALLDATDRETKMKRFPINMMFGTVRTMNSFCPTHGYTTKVN